MTNWNKMARLAERANLRESFLGYWIEQYKHQHYLEDVDILRMLCGIHGTSEDLIRVRLCGKPKSIDDCEEIAVKLGVSQDAVEKIAGFH